MEQNTDISTELGHATTTKNWVDPILFALVRQQSGEECFSCPASTTTMITMGSFSMLRRAISSVDCNPIFRPEGTSSSDGPVLNICTRSSHFRFEASGDVSAKEALVRAFQPAQLALTSKMRRLENLWHNAVRLLVVMAIVRVFLLAIAAQADDRRLWLIQTVETETTHKSKASMQQGVYFASDEPNLYAHYVEASFVHNTIGRLDLGGGFRELFEQKGNSWLEENRPFAIATLKWQWWGWPFSDRNQIEWRNLEGRDNQVRYRNRVMAEIPAQWTSWHINPYVSDEFFFDDESNELLKDRFAIGLKCKPLRWFSVDVYGMWESSDTGINEKGKVYIAGLKFVASL